MNLYYYLYYLIYKFLYLNAPEETKARVPSVSGNLFFIGLTNYFAAFVLFLKPFKYISYNLITLICVFIAPITILYFFNERYLIKNEKYKLIESHFDKSNKLTKPHFIFLAVSYLFGSIITMIWAGINY